MDTLMVTISQIIRTKPNVDDDYEDETVTQFYRQEIPLDYIHEHRPNLMRAIIAVCNELTFPKE